MLNVIKTFTSNLAKDGKKGKTQKEIKKEMGKKIEKEMKKHKKDKKKKEKKEKKDKDKTGKKKKKKLKKIASTFKALMFFKHAHKNKDHNKDEKDCKPCDQIINLGNQAGDKLVDLIQALGLNINEQIENFTTEDLEMLRE